MDKVVAAIAMLLLALMAGMGSTSSSLAKASCKPIAFPDGKNTAVLSGLAPVDDVVCYGLDAEVGQSLTLKVLRGDNTVFGIQDVQDAVDEFTFTAQKTNYEIRVGQLMRARRPQTFRISVERSEDTAAEEPWAIGITVGRLPQLRAEQMAEDGSGRLRLSCARNSGTGFEVSLHDYAGDALGRGGDTEYPVKLVVADSRVGGQSFDLRMRYSVQDKVWTSDGSAPRGFIRSFEAGPRLTLVNGGGIPVAAFNLHGSSEYAKTALIYCGGDNKTVAVAMPATAEGSVANAETVSSPALVASSEAETGAPFRDCEHCPEMVPVPPGSFMMGASPKEMKQLKYVQWATPQHEVSIAYQFAIGRFEVTVEEFDAYVKETGAQVGGKCGIRTIESGPNKFKYNGTLVPGGDKTQSAPYAIYIGDGSYAQPGLHRRRR